MPDKIFNIKLKLLSKGSVLKVDKDKIVLSKEFEKKLGDKGLLKKDLFEIGQRVAYRIAQNIHEKKRPDGSPQKRNSDEWITRKGFDHPVLETGKMLQSIKAVKEGDKVVVRLAKTQYAARLPKRKNIKNRPLNSYSPKSRARPTVNKVAGYLQEMGYDFFGVKKGFYQEAIRDTILKRLGFPGGGSSLRKAASKNS